LENPLFSGKLPFLHGKTKRAKAPEPSAFARRHAANPSTKLSGIRGA
jgi:hypothetical protein